MKAYLALVIPLLLCSTVFCTSSAPGNPGTGPSIDAGGDADADADAWNGTSSDAGACGSVGPWGEWPPADAAPRTLEMLPPAFDRPDCGPGCRLMTTRYGASTLLPYETRFSGTWLAHASGTPDTPQAIVVDLDSNTEHTVPMPQPEPGAYSFDVSLAAGSAFQSFQYFDDITGAQRSYVCETSTLSNATRGILSQLGTIELRNASGLYVASTHFVVLGGGLASPTEGKGTWVKDLRDGSEHRIAKPSIVDNVTIHEPYIAIAPGDGDIHLIDTRDWSDTNVSADPALQWMPATDGKTVVWIDQRYHPGADPENPNNQEVVAYDIATQTTTRLTYTDGSKPSAKWNPDVEGNWVVWTDDRDSDFPNRTQDIPKNRADIYAYHLALKREYHVLGNHAGTLPEDDHNPGTGLQPRNPRLHRGKLYVLGPYPDHGNPHLQVWEIAMPHLRE